MLEGFSRNASLVNPAGCARDHEIFCERPELGSANYSMQYVSCDVFDQHLGDFEDVSFEQTAAYNTMRWGSERTRCAVFQCRGKTVALACFVVIKIPLIGRGLAYIKHGPIWRHRRFVHSMETYGQVIKLLQSELSHKDRHLLVIVPRSDPRIQEFENVELRRLGLANCGQARDPNRYFVKLELSSEKQLKTLGQKWRYNLKRTQKNQVDVDVVENPTAIRTFQALHSNMASRKKFYSAEPTSALEKMGESFPENLRPSIFLAKTSGEAIAGAAVMNCGDVAHYLFGATSDAALPLRAGYALQWRILDHLRSQGVRWYDLGGEAGMQGLRQFKKGLIGKNGIVLSAPGEFYYCAGPVSAATQKLVIAARDALRVLRTRRM